MPASRLARSVSDDSACQFATAQHIDPFAEHGKANDPLISPSPEDEDNGEDGDACDKNIRANVYIREEKEKRREAKRQNAENQKQSKVDLPAPRDALRLIEIKVVGEKQGEKR